jgi:hypothetical protein
MPNQLGPVNFQLGVIAGNKSANPLLSRLIPGINDGKVSVNRTRIEGMKDFIVLPYTHSFIMRQKPVMDQVLHFIQRGCFAR